MASQETITSLTNPRIKQVVRLRKARERRQAGVFIAEGFREVQRAVAAGLELLEVFACDDLADASAEVRSLVASLDHAAATHQLTRVNAVVLRKMAYHDKPEGVLAVCSTPRWELDQLAVPEDGFYLIAVGTEKPGNLGAMVRTAAAAGCHAVLAVGPAVDVFNPNAIRNSTAAVFSLPTVVVEDAATAIDWLKQHRIAIAAALADGGSDSFTTDWARPGGRVAVVVGPEHAGLDTPWRDAADVALTIPFPGVSEGDAGGVDSLNASNAAAVLLFEAVRRRRAT